MKTILKIFIGILIIIGSAYYDYYMYDEMIQNDTETSVLVDVTDQPTSIITGVQVIDYIGIPQHKWSSHTIWFSAITNYTFESRWNAHIDKQYLVLANPYMRDKTVRELTKRVDSSMSALYAKDSSLSASCIYEPIIRELNRLSKSTSHHRTMIIHSDLGMNYDLFSVFHPADMKELNQHPEKIIEKLESKLRPKNLKDINVVFIYKCKDTEANRRYILMLNIMSKILSSHGANVSNEVTLIRQN